MYVTIDGTKLYCEVSGQGPPLVFIHGFPVRGEMWYATARELPDWKCVVPDLRGFGRSAVSDSVTIERFSDDLAAILDAIGERRPAIICGLSMGGVIAFDFFRRYHARVRALVLVDCRANAESEDGKRNREELAQGVLRHGSRFAAEGMIPKVFAPGVDPQVRSYWYDVICAMSPAGVAAAARGLSERADSNPTLGQIDVPTILIFGEQDEITPPDLARRMHAAIPGSRLEFIPNAGHVPPVEQPERFVSVLRAFLHTLPSLSG
jgi:3-oxoadipate enol-lactonase